jgi:hypothetical protein
VVEEEVLEILQERQDLEDSVAVVMEQQVPVIMVIMELQTLVVEQGDLGVVLEFAQ